MTNIQAKFVSNCAPSAIMMARMTRAPATPMRSTRCWYILGTANAVSSIMNRNRLSTLSDFSTR